jgi:2-iminobutanoate/2-iminopropanoate deaminase
VSALAAFLLAAVQSTPAPPPSPPAWQNPDGVAPPIGAYSHVALVPPGRGLIVLAGQIGNAPDGKLADTADAQFEAALRNVATLLASQGASPRDLVKLTIYLVQPLDRARAAAARKAILGDAVPPSTLVYVVRLARPEILVEVEATALQPH